MTFISIDYSTPVLDRSDWDSSIHLSDKKYVLDELS